MKANFYFFSKLKIVGWASWYFMFFFAILIPNLAVSGNKVLVLKNDEVYQIDSSSFIQVDSVGLQKFSANVNDPVNRLFFHNPSTDKSYWYKFQVRNESDTIFDWLLVSYNYSIDEIDVLVYDQNGKVNEQIFRDTIGLYDRNIKHKQPVFTLSFLPHETKTIYLRIKNESPYEYVFAIFSDKNFLSHFFLEYLLYGLFYGFMIFVLLYSIMNSVFFKDYVILIYACFIASQILHMMFRDGNGLFLFPSSSGHADLIKNISRSILAVSLILYTAYFLKINSKSRLFNAILAMVGLRLIYGFVMLEDTTQITFYIELFIITLCTFLSVRSYIKGNSDAKYMSIGLGILCVSYFIYYICIIALPLFGAVGFFSMYFGVALESVFMTMALTERFKRIRLDNFKKEQMNKELEKLVKERTETITYQNKLLADRSEELNLFLYSTSHDLKGPIKTILGLCYMGMIDKEADHNMIYSMIQNKLRNLESNINDLNLVTALKNEGKTKIPVDFNNLHDETVRRYRDFPGYKDLDLELDVKVKDEYYSELFPLRCIYQNIFENAIKYKDEKKKSYLKISISQSENNLELRFKDNGEGIDPARLPNIFNMYYRANEKSNEDTGLGLYIVKLAVQKLGGEISAESVSGEGTTVIANLPFKFN